jgi:hypothetical protein
MKKAMLLAALFAGAAAVHGQSTFFTITLTGDAERPLPATPSTATGTGTATLTGNILDVSVSYSGIENSPSGAHIHGPATTEASAGVLFPFSVAGLGTSGTINGSFTYGAEQITDLMNGLHYVNIHTQPNFPGGEIRGQIVVVPEPSTLALAGLGVGALVLARRRKK